MNAKRPRNYLGSGRERDRKGGNGDSGQKNIILVVRRSANARLVGRLGMFMVYVLRCSLECGTKVWWKRNCCNGLTVAEHVRAAERTVSVQTTCITSEKEHRNEVLRGIVMVALRRGKVEEQCVV